jgi:hypothetical protein
LIAIGNASLRSALLVLHFLKKIFTSIYRDNWGNRLIIEEIR